MKHWTKLVLFGLLTAMLLCACGKKPIQVDVPKMAESLAEEVTFTDELSKIDDAMLEILYPAAIKDLVNSYSIYVGSGATAEEIAVFEAKDADSVKQLQSILEEHVKSQISSFEDYIPEEVKRLENAIVQVGGSYAVLCVTEDVDTAQSVIDRYLK